ncbi:MAG: VOC family protein [Sulfitobacter sp.]
MNASFGIDHPLLATHDIEGLRARLIAMGFNMTAVGKHPWGTSTSLAMFDGCLLEIMGIYDEKLIDEVPAGDFRFGRHIYEHLQTREGVALSALHSTNSRADAERAEALGLTVAGHLEFGRDVALPDGTAGRTKTTLALLPHAAFPRLSFFLCQQHRPDLIYVSEWLLHPNKVSGICGVNIVANKGNHRDLKLLFGGLYSEITEGAGGFECQTANGVMRVMTKEAFEERIGPLPDAVLQDQSPFVAGMDLTMSDTQVMATFLERSNTAFRNIDQGFALSDPSLTANTVLRFLMHSD